MGYDPQGNNMDNSLQQTDGKSTSRMRMQQNYQQQVSSQNQNNSSLSQQHQQ